MLNSYPYVFVGGANHVYAFTTENFLDYEVKFVPSGYLFEHLSDTIVDAYEMVIAVTNKGDVDRIPADAVIQSTVKDIFVNFLDQNEKIIIYVCDTSDRRQRARARKFAMWFFQGLLQTGMKLGKIDRQVVASDDEQILMSMFIHLQHPHRLAIIDAFFTIGNDEK